MGSLTLLSLEVTLLLLFKLRLTLDIPLLEVFPTVQLLNTKEPKSFPVLSLLVNLSLALLSMQVIMVMVSPSMAEGNVKPRPKLRLRLRLILNLGITAIMDTIWVIMADTMVDTMDIPMGMDITMANKEIKPQW